MADYVQEFNTKVRDFKRELVRVELNKRPEKEVNFFNRMYKSIDEIKEDKMPWAYSQIKMSEKKEAASLLTEQDDA